MNKFKLIILSIISTNFIFLQAEWESIELVNGTGHEIVIDVDSGSSQDPKDRKLSSKHSVNLTYLKNKKISKFNIKDAHSGQVIDFSSQIGLDLARENKQGLWNAEIIVEHPSKSDTPKLSYYFHTVNVDNVGVAINLMQDAKLKGNLVLYISKKASWSDIKERLIKQSDIAKNMLENSDKDIVVRIKNEEIKLSDIGSEEKFNLKDTDVITIKEFIKK